MAKEEPVDDFGEPLEGPTTPAKRSARPGNTAPAKPPARPARPPRAGTGPVTVGDEKTVHRETVSTVSMENRKLTKKQQQHITDKWAGDNRGRVVDVLFRAQAEVARKQYGNSSVLVGDKRENVVIGIPCPFVFEYLIQQSVMPLSLILQVVGPTGTCKSALLYEFMRWFRMAGGGSILQEAESKFSPELLKSIVGFEDDQVNVIVNRCNSLEEWQQKLLYWIQYEKKAMDGTKDEPGPGRIVPVLFGVDSIMGKASAETQEKVLDAGSAGRSYPLEALSITGFMRTVPQLLDGFPFTIVLNNHLKMSTDDMGNDVRGIAGGQGVRFQESFEIETKVRKSKISCSDWDGVMINLKCFKNSFGAGQRNADARMLWWSEETAPGSGIYQQATEWDWHWATVRLLTSVKDRDASQLKQHGFHISAPKTSDVENLAWSANLGMREKDAVPWRELGKRLVEDAATLKILRDALGIKRRPLLAGDYIQQLNHILEGS